MGKPFKTELKNLNKTYRWLLDEDFSQLRNYLYSLRDKSLVAVGSGGSYSASSLASLLHQDVSGKVSKALTPLDTFYSLNQMKECAYLFISASGSNYDIVSSFKQIIKQEPVSVATINMKEDTSLKALKTKKSYALKNFEYELPAGKDGFLATNSLLAYFYILLISYFPKLKFDKNLIQNINYESFGNQLSNKISGINSFTVLYSGLALPIAEDIESKLTEAALTNVSISDYRNFGHGRHHWFAKKRENSGIIALIHNNDKALAEKTIKSIPDDIPLIKIESNFNSKQFLIDLLIKSFHLVDKLGDREKIDPGNPSVPKFGRDLYNLNYLSLYKNKKSTNFDRKKTIAIKRKISSKNISKTLLGEWGKKYDRFTSEIEKQKFIGLILDYDGTLCSKENRFEGLSSTIAKEITKLLKSDIIIGIISGRGKSLGEDLRKAIDKEFWNKIIVGYYNGSDIGLLSNKALPNKDAPIHKSLSTLVEYLKGKQKLLPEFNFEVRPNQITIETNEIDSNHLFEMLLAFIELKKINVKLFRSSHSFDIIPNTISKVNMIDFCRDLSDKSNFNGEFLCIGDKGKWPGNDSELLQHKYSLSVNEIPIEEDNCWNLAAVGTRGVSVTLQYLESITINDQHFTIKVS